jgi:serine protease Do
MRMDSRLDILRGSLQTFLLAIGLSCVSLALPQDVGTPDSLATEPVTAAVVQLLAVGPGAEDKNRECAATGFLVNEDGYLLTNAHVIADARRCLAASPGTKIMAKLARPGARAAPAVSCDVVGLDDLHDLALLKTERPLPEGERPAYARLDPAEIAEGTPVAVTGHPAFVWHPTTQKGRVIRRAALRLSEKSKEKSDVIVLDIPLRPGASGSPVFLQAGGGVVGIIERQNPARPSETVAVPIRYAIELVNSHGVRWYSAPR